MKEYLLFIVPAIFGTVIGLSIFRILYRDLAEQVSVYQRLACSFGGAFLGAFAGALLLPAFPAIADWPANWIVVTVLSVITAVGIQKFVAEQE
jgi:hypothetical protein